MTGPITWAALGALLPLIGAAISFGMLLAKVNRLGIDYAGLDGKFDILREKVEDSLRTQTEHAAEIRSLQYHQSETQKELLALLRAYYGVKTDNSRGSLDPNGDLEL